MEKDLHSNTFFSLLFLHERGRKIILKSKHPRAGMTYGIGLSHFWPRELSPLSTTPEPPSCACHAQTAKLPLPPSQAHSAEGDFHFAPGKELHTLMKMFPLPVYSPKSTLSLCLFQLRGLLPLLGPAAQSWLCLAPCSPSPPSLCCHHSMARNC